MNGTVRAMRREGLERLCAFLPRAGTVYARGRNRDQGPGRREAVSVLSPWLRHRLLTEHEVVAAVLEAHGPERAEQFVQEVCWRTYWKGWLQQRPAVWRDYRVARDAALQRLGQDGPQKVAFDRAVSGATGIDAFDAWARELIDTGYLHNHARMSFASIWIFTMGLPWELGADFFHRHLLDGDAASNTLSWRWVAGLQTPGKHYLARAEKIRFCSEGRFNPVGQLHEAAEALPCAGSHPPPEALPPLHPIASGERYALLISDEDAHPESWPVPSGVALGCALLVDSSALRSPLPVAEGVRGFSAAALDDAAERISERWQLPCRRVAPGELSATAAAAGCSRLLGVEPAVGPLHDALAVEGDGASSAVWVRRAWDAAFWPQATRGFFALKKRIPETLRELGLPA